MKKILVPTDFSPCARIATDVAVDMAKRLNAEIILLHVIDQPTSSSFNVEGEVNYDGDWEDKLFTLKMIQKSKGQLAEVAEHIERSGIIVKQELRLGNPFHGIHTLVAEHRVDLVIMGTEGHSRLERMIIGSNTEKVIRHSHCPVLTVNKKPSNLDFRNIVFATSLMKEEESFVAVLIALQQTYDAMLHIVWINSLQLFQPDNTVKRAMQEFVSRLGIKKYTLNVFSDYSVEEGVTHFADSINADMIAMATHGRTGFAHVIAGSLAEDVAVHARRPVLTYVVK
jgi:nucleotide-binding universal stress UspA family protein